MKNKIKKILLFLTNPRLLFCFFLAWMITNGWSYVMLGIGTYYGIDWMIAVAGGYLAFLWLPISPEKIATCAIAIFLLRLLFPRDKKTLAVLKDLYHKAKDKAKRFLKKHKKNRLDNAIKPPDDPSNDPPDDPPPAP